ncbi:ferredoxin [Nocardia tengchongensis]|uniref:ferredoxin n=1 Tax=Nocardia tengchongensis TaxID=2055889 RepID=UPI00360D925E
MKVSIDSSLCDSHGQCIAVSEGLFDFDTDGTTVLTTDATEEHRPLAILAAASCPSLAISVSDA